MLTLIENFFFKYVRDMDDKHDAVYTVAAHSAFMIVLWCILEAFVLEGLVDFVVGFLNGMERFLDLLYLDWIGHIFDYSGDMVRKHLRYLGTGDLGDWISRGTWMWVMTGLPAFIWQMHRRENP